MRVEIETLFSCHAPWLRRHNPFEPPPLPPAQLEFTPDSRPR